MQETYVQSATSTWLEGLDRSLAQMKEYQVRNQISGVIVCTCHQSANRVAERP